MLARVADNLYWMSRYLERADQTARLLEVQVGSLADHPAAAVAGGWRRLFHALAVTPPGRLEFFADMAEEDFLLADAYVLADFMTFEPDNPGSVRSLWASARENARQARQEITSEMWSRMNRAYLKLRDTEMHSFWNAEPQNFYRDTSANVSLFRGITDNSLRHGQSWDFIRLGRFIERIQITAEILEAHRPALGSEGDTLDWSLLLRGCASFEPYCKRHTAVIEAKRVMEFLLFEPRSPHSLRFAAEMLRSGLRRVDPIGGGRHPLAPPHRLVGRLRSILAYSSGREDLFEGTLAQVRAIASSLHDEINNRYMFYSADQALRMG